MFNQRKNRLMSFISMLLSVVMVIASCQFTAFAAETVTQGLWTINNDTASGTATYSDIGFTYYSPTTVLTYGSNGGKDYVRSNNTNGSASNGIVTTANKSYCDFTPTTDGTLTVYVGNASSKVGYVSRTSTDSQKSEAVGSFVPGGSDNYDTTGFKVTQGTTWATVDIEVESGYTYYITLSGSKMFCYGADFVPYTPVSGTINDSFNLGEYTIKFTNKTTGEAKEASVSGNTYTISLKPGYQYAVALTGSAAAGYAFTNDTRLVTVEVLDSQTADLTVEESVSYTVSGTISGLADGYNAGDFSLVFVPEDTTSHENVTANIDMANKTYNAMLVANETYTLTLVGAYDYELDGTNTVYNESAEAVTKDITLTAVPTYAVSGKFLGLTQVRGTYETLNVNPTEIKFTNVGDNYVYTGTVANGEYSANLRDGSYLASITSDSYSTSTHVVVNGGAVTRDLLLKDESVKTVQYTDTIYVGADKEYKSVQSAVDAVTNMTRANGERVTIKIDPGTYREQVVVNTPNITLESNGGTRDNTKITWYYGIGYKYYSTVNSYYDPYADYDKFTKGNVEKYWGSCVITNKTAEGFRASNITFENSFNKYMTSEEMTDGVEVNGLQSINVVRKETTNVDSRAATERAAALVNYADKLEFNNCSFIGSQDTLYTCNVEYDSYYKNCYIEGQTDFIYGNGDVIFDGCEINFCGYDGTQAAGYLTANSSDSAHPATDGYIFRSCYISYNAERDTTAGTFGRMWGAGAKVAFINTQLQEADMITGPGWTAMTVDPSASTVQLTEFNTTHNGVQVDTSSRVNGVVDSIDNDVYSVENVFINKGWTPAYYTGDDKVIPTFKAEPTMTSNGDLNAPNPGETITLGYSLASGLEDEDASRISWYAVAEGYDDTSLETLLASATLLKTTSAASTNKFQIPMECAGSYIMAVVTPITNYGDMGEAKYILDKEKPVSNTWSDPDNEGSIAPGSGINIYLAGDSTVKDYSANGIYNGGKTLDSGSWGEYLQNFFDEKLVTVNNYAQGGRSSRSFINEGKLDTIIGQIKSGDYLLIQFGHNDCANGASYYEERFAPLYTKDNPYVEGQSYPTVVPTEDMKVSTPTALQGSYGSTYYSWDCGATYKGYIQKYIDEALAKGAIPVIVSPVARLYYNSDGTIKSHHDANMTDYAGTLDYLTTNDAYVTACEELYNENVDKGVLYIDAFNMTKKLYEEAYTASGSATNGEDIMAAADKTHSNKTGGVIQAGLLAKWIQDANISVSNYVVQPTTVYGENSNGQYIFTIKNSQFTAKNNSFNENSYWTLYGQELFDSLSGAVNKVVLDFATNDSLALYETNASTTYTDGVYSGTYTNEGGQKFKSSVYQAGIAYYNSTPSFGTKATPGKPIFSFDASGAGVYKIAITTSTGDGTINMYSDSACTNSIASGASTDTISYTKTTDTTETIYFTASASNNMYIKNITLTKEEVPVVKANVVNLNFASADALALYETNATETYTAGVYSGEYTNTDGRVFEASVYQSGIQYFNGQSTYGTKASVGKAIFSFKANEAATYTVNVTTSTGSGTVNLYSDADCTNIVATAAAPGSIVYKKSDATEETLYFAASEAPNMYISDVSITAVVPKTITLNFATDEALALYETNADTSYVGGVCTGTYTNSSNQSFDVNVYKTGIQYYNSQVQYGTKASVGMPVFSITLNEKGMYTFAVSAGTGNGTISLYNDETCTTSVVDGTVPGNVIYKKKTDGAETLYFATSIANNLYVSNVDITKSDLPADVKVNFKGDVSGIESDDTNVIITLKGQTETLNVNANDYTTNGIELIVGETYDITAKGDKGIYTGTSIVTDDSGVANLILSRLVFEFPLDFMDYYDDYKTYLEAMNYGSANITDPYSGITVYPGAIVQTDAYRSFGVKTNANNIISFTAKQTGTCTVTIETSVSNADQLILKVNDRYAPVLKTAVQNSTVELSTMVNKDDVVTIYTPTRSNLWYNSINVTYTDIAFITNEAVVNTVDDELMVYGSVPSEFVGNIESIGFYYSSGVASELAEAVVADESSSVFAQAVYNGNTYSVNNNYIWGTVLEGLSEITEDTIYVYTFCKTTDGKTYYSAPTEVNIR